MGPVGILVDNAGLTRDVSLHKTTDDQWDLVLRTDLSSVFNMCRPVIGGMRARGFGGIANISSINSQKGRFGQANYCAAKAGVIGFAKPLAPEGGVKGVTVNAVAPGYVETAMAAAFRPTGLRRSRPPFLPDGWGGPKRGRAVSPSWSTTPDSSPARPWPSTAANP